MNKMNNKGFTLVELIGVMVILIIITAVAVPNISTSVERAKAKKNLQTTKSLEYAVELYFSDHKEARNNTNCYIDINEELVKERYIMKDEVITDKPYLIYTKNGNNMNLQLEENIGGKTKCVS